MGVPGIYLHGLLGSKNDAEAVLEEGQTRSINRTSIMKKELLAEMENKSSTIYQVATGITRLIHYRIQEKCFHPDAPQRILSLSDKVFAVLRSSTKGREQILAIINISKDKEPLSVDLKKHGLRGQHWTCLLNKSSYSAVNEKLELKLDPYDILWLKERT
jgi:sucrose phosphorylase